MKEFIRLMIIFVLSFSIVFLSCSIVSLVKNENNIFSIAMLSGNKDGFIKASGFLIDKNEKISDSGISGDEYTFSTDYFPYFGLLNPRQKAVYKQVYANALEYKENFIPVEKISVDETLVVLEAVLNDHPELYWLSNTFNYRYSNNNICKQITLIYNGTQDNDKFRIISKEIINKAREYKTDFERELYVHDTLINMIEYDKNASNNQSAFSALVNGYSVCAGYARAFQYIMMQLGIPTYYVSGVSEGEDHAWNIIKLDGEYYNVDLTWDDAVYDKHMYFNLTDEGFSNSHERRRLSVDLPECNSIVNSYKAKRYLYN